MLVERRPHPGKERRQSVEGFLGDPATIVIRREQSLYDAAVKRYNTAVKAEQARRADRLWGKS